MKPRNAAVPTEWPDERLREGLRVQSPEAVEALVYQYGPKAYRLALRITGSAEDAEEVSQDVLWTVIRKIDSFRGESALGSWIYRISANAAYQKLRGRRGKDQISWEASLPPFDAAGHLVEMERDWTPSVEDPALQAEARRHLIEAVDALPADYRAAFVLHDMEGLPNPDVADVLGISLPAVKSRVHRSRLFLRQKLAQYFGRTP